MPGKIEPLQDRWIPALSQFLKAGLCKPGDYCDFAQPEILRWKFFGPRGHWNVPRSLMLRKGDEILAHVGICTTEFTGAGQQSAATPAVHMTDWLSREEGGSLGTLLMLQAFGLAPVQYALGCTQAAERVLRGVGFEKILEAGVFHRVLRRKNPAVWRAIHGKGRALARQAALLACDFAQSFKPAQKARTISARKVERFDSRVDQLLQQSDYQATITSRSPTLLNYYLQFPRQNISGWLLEKNSECIGFALLALIEKPGLRHGRIVECFLRPNELNLWSDALSALRVELERMDAALITCCASTPWMSEALRRSGFFRRGRIPFLLRDPKKLVHRSRPFHLSYLEADLAYI